MEQHLKGGGGVPETYTKISGAKILEKERFGDLSVN
jgi:hypothetical protein